MSRVRQVRALLAGLLLTLAGAGEVAAQSGPKVLFIGNSFTFGSGSAVRFYRGESVTDLNRGGIGGVPALFRSFADQAGLAFDVYLETQPGSGFEFHLENRRTELASQPWDIVVMHGQSALDLQNHGDPTKFLATARELAEFLVELHPEVELYLTATWSRADLTYPESTAWHGRPIEAMALDVRAAYDRAAAESPRVRGVNPVGEAWNLAMARGVADPNPYDGIGAGQMNLWTTDHYHASTYGYYLHALVVFGNVTGVDPRSLGDTECSGFELGMSRAQIRALQEVAAEQLTAQRAPLRSMEIARSNSPGRCAVASR